MRNLLFFVFVVLVVELSLVVLTDSLLQPTQLGLVDSGVPRLPNTAGTEPTDLLFLSKTPSPLPSPSPSSNSRHKNTGNIFVRFDGDEHHGDSFSSSFSSSFSFRDEARNIATTLGIPFLSAAEASDRRGEPFTHALMLVPYDCGTKESTFALAIEPFDSSSSSSSSSRKQQRSRRKRSKTKPSAAAFFVDLCPPSGSRAGKRAAGASGTSDLLVKAVGPRKGIEARDGRQTQTQTRTGNGNGAVVWDLTAGLGQDSLVLARNGARRVRMVERHPVVAALLGDALRRLECIANTSASATANSNANATANATATANAPESSSSDRSKLAASLLDTLDLTVGDGRDVLREHHDAECDSDSDNDTYNNGCDVVYLDPMFPPRQKSSAVKKGMSILHGLLLETHVPNNNINNKGNNDDDGNGNGNNDAKEQTETETEPETARQTEEQELLESATSVARLRVVVKRPIKAPPLGDGSKKPSYAVEGSTNRWDVYVSPKPA